MRARILIDQDYCKGCALCVEVCPRQLIAMSRQLNAAGVFPAEVGADKMASCTGCALCAQICPDVAISVFRETS